MCTIAGYIGTKKASTILIEMLKKQEGFDSGFYTGIATVCDGKIYYAKLTGDLERLETLKKVSEFPGTIGFIHSRTKSGGGDEYAHPFVGLNRDGEAELAFIANGTAGIFSGDSEKKGKIADQLIEQGYILRSKAELESGKYPRLADGSMVHESDIKAQLTYRTILSGQTPYDALASASKECRVEDVGLLLSLTDESKIFYARNNFPMFIGKSKHGSYLASTPIAFPSDAGEPILLPESSCGWVSKDEVFTKTFTPLASIAPITEEIKNEARAKIIEMLEEGEKTYSQLRRALLYLFSGYEMNQCAPVVYGELYNLYRDGLIEFTEVRVDGVNEGTTAPLYYIRKKEKNVNA